LLLRSRSLERLQMLPSWLQRAPTFPQENVRPFVPRQRSAFCYGQKWCCGVHAQRRCSKHQRLGSKKHARSTSCMSMLKAPFVEKW
jgi:hypothetical protein